MKFIVDIFNLTPHPITVGEGVHKVTYLPMEVDELPSVQQPAEQVEVNGIPIRYINLSIITHLPEPDFGTLYIVPETVAKAAPHRNDLICPDPPKGFVSYATEQKSDEDRLYLPGDKDYELFCKARREGSIWI